MLQRKTHGQRPRAIPTARGYGRPARLGAWLVAALMAMTAGGSSGHDVRGAATPTATPALMPTGAPALAMQALAMPGLGPCPRRPGLSEGNAMFSANKLTAA